MHTGTSYPHKSSPQHQPTNSTSKPHPSTSDLAATFWSFQASFLYEGSRENIISIWLPSVISSSSWLLLFWLWIKSCRFFSLGEMPDEAHHNPILQLCFIGRTNHMRGQDSESNIFQLKLVELYQTLCTWFIHKQIQQVRRLPKCRIKWPRSFQYQNHLWRPFQLTRIPCHLDRCPRHTMAQNWRVNTLILKEMVSCSAWYYVLEFLDLLSILLAIWKLGAC